MAELYARSGRIIEARLMGDSIKAIAGSMVSYQGEVKFQTAGFGGGQGVVSALKQRATGESLKLMECTGNGTVQFAVNAQYVTVLPVQNETLQVESRQLLALAGNLTTNVTFTGLRGASTGGQGLFTTTVTGMGQVALLSAGGPLIHLEVNPQLPVAVDPQAFVCAKGQLQSSFITDVSWRDAVGQGGGEAFTLSWQGSGVVSIQPAER